MQELTFKEKESLFSLSYQLLAAIAYDGYLKNGRGLIIVEPAHIEKLFKDSHWQLPTLKRNFRCVYIGENSQAFQQLFKGNWGKLKPIVEGYNPTQVGQIVFYNQQEQSFTVYFLEAPLVNPVKSYQSLKARLIEFYYSGER